MVEERGTSAREEILARVRAATVGAAVPAAPSPRVQVGAGSVDLFVERVADYRAVVERCAPDELADRVAAAVRGCSVVVPDGLGVSVDGCPRRRRALGRRAR